MPLNTSDEKILTILNLAINRDEIIGGVCSVLERLKLYRDNLDLMKRIDVAEALLRDLEDLLNVEHQMALEELEKDENLLKQLRQLSAEGKDAFWTNGDLELSSGVEFLPWRWDD